MVEDKPIRVLVGKPGLDGHDRGAKVVAKALRDAGMEVIYTGRHLPVGAIVRTAVDEDVDVVGLSVLSGAHLDYCRRLVEALNAADAGDMVLVVGGIIPHDDVAELETLGFAVFGTGSDLGEISAYIEDRVAEQRAARAGS